MNFFYGFLSSKVTARGHATPLVEISMSKNSPIALLSADYIFNLGISLWPLAANGQESRILSTGTQSESA